MRIPGLYKKVPGIFSEQTPKLFGVTAGFASRDIQTTGGVWRIDMTKCPYHDASVHYGCPELCHCFCDSDDITYDGLHPNLAGYTIMARTWFTPVNDKINAMTSLPWLMLLLD